MVLKGIFSAVLDLVDVWVDKLRREAQAIESPSQAMFIVESVRKFFEHERLYNKAVMHNRVVDCTAKAYGIGTATVKRIHQEFADFSGTLKSVVMRDKNQDDGERVLENTVITLYNNYPRPRGRRVQYLVGLCVCVCVCVCVCYHKIAV